MFGSSRGVKSVVFAVVLLEGALARADIPHCGWAPASWNAPNGAVVFSKGPGPVDAVLSAVGEFRSHSMLSHGTNGYISHATMREPGANDWPALCSTPVNPAALEAGYPGWEQVNQGAIYTFLYGGGVTWLGYQLGDPAAAASIADSVFWNYPIFFNDPTPEDPSRGIDHPARNGARVPYSLHQFRDIETANTAPGSSFRNGMVCSTFLAYAHAYAGRGVIPAFGYGHSQLNQAAWALFNSVSNDCSSGSGFWGQVAVAAGACAWNPFDPFPNLCARAANQVANCMATGTCNSTATTWLNIANDPASTARTISPDRIGGWGVHPWNIDTWSPDNNHDVQWNVGGAVYGCWD
jgi:hypothetical protein